MSKRSLVILSLLALMVPAACKSSESTGSASDTKTTTTTTTTTTASKPKPTGVVKLTGQKIDGGTFSMTVPNGWVKQSEPPAKAASFDGVFMYSSDKTENAAAYAEVRKGKFDFVSADEDRKAVWAAIQAATKADYGTDAEFGQNYESNDGFTYSASYKGKKQDGFVYFNRKGDTVYYVDAGGDLSRTSEKDTWSIIESFETK
ncbi:MAG: hypothetical protein H7338_04625 [Candidatus Sericytochromatia bacterium]|nr:hypothetical protein [Candidatus Sericytochromatia bacterium]